MLDFPRSVTWPFGEDNDLVFRKVWYRINRSTNRRAHAPKHNEASNHDDEPAAANRKSDDAVDHRDYLFPSLERYFDGDFSNGSRQPSQQMKTGLPLTITRTGPPIESRSPSLTGQIRCRSTIRRSSGESVPGNDGA